MPQIDEDPLRASKAFGERLKGLRRKLGPSQDDVARKADIHPTAIGRLERGSRKPRLTTILRVARGLGVNPSELLNDLGSPRSD